MRDHDIQHKQTFVPQPGIGFDDDESVPVVMPEHEKVESEISNEDAHRVREETLVNFLSFLLRAGTGTAEEIGRMVLVISYLLKRPDGPRTLEQVGALFRGEDGKLGVGKARVSQILSALNLESGDFTRLFD